MNRAVKIGLTLLALLLVALVVSLAHRNGHGLMALIVGLPVIGFTVTYGFAGAASGTTTAPTAGQSSTLPAITCQLAMGDTETQAFITHNWGLPASAPSFFFPEINYLVQVNSGAQTQVPCLTFSWLNTNVLVVNKLNALLSGGTFVVYLRKPHSIGL